MDLLDGCPAFVHLHQPTTPGFLSLLIAGRFKHRFCNHQHIDGGSDIGVFHALLDEEVTNRTCASFRQSLIVFFAANAVGMALDLKLKSRMGENDSRHLGQLLSSSGFERPFARVE